MTQRLAQRFRHFGGFVLAGAMALIVDIIVLQLLMSLAGLAAAMARLVAIAMAMVVSWLINRTVTFAVAAPPSWPEFSKFAAASWLAQAVNYGVFLVLLAAVPNLPAPLAVVGASLVAMVVSYVGFRYGVFRQSQADTSSGAQRL
ncbi:MAG: GtrA family protein [Pseudomonadota bacterium]